jgi:hypothetical protein
LVDELKSICRSFQNGIINKKSTKILKNFPISKIPNLPTQTYKPKFPKPNSTKPITILLPTGPKSRLLPKTKSKKTPSTTQHNINTLNQPYPP